VSVSLSLCVRIFPGVYVSLFRCARASSFVCVHLCCVSPVCAHVLISLCAQFLLSLCLCIHTCMCACVRYCVFLCVPMRICVCPCASMCVLVCVLISSTLIDLTAVMWNRMFNPLPRLM
jgi:hypothetical protein